MSAIITSEQAAAIQLAKNLGDPMWRICSGKLYKIVVKKEGDDGEGLVMPFMPNRAQKKFIARLHHRNIILKARQLGFCVDPTTRVLTADLRWIPISELSEGQQVVAVDEHVPGGKGQGRKMRTATVQAVAEVYRKAYRITFDDGRTVVCTAQHPWLSRKTATDAQWRSIDGTGNAVVGRLKVGTKVRWVTKPWDQDRSFDDGWMGGMLDGEGSMALPASSGAEINVAQVQGPAFGRMEMYLSQRGYNYRTEEDQAERKSKFGKTAVHKLCISRMDEMFRLIGQTRPIRFLGRHFWEGKELPGKRNGIGWATITNIEELGEQRMIDLQTSTGTYIAEGFVSHNTTLIAIIWLDHALFNANVKCGIIAQDRETAESIFLEKVKFAYDNLPDALRAMMPLESCTKTQMIFGHNKSIIRVATSVRGGTIHRLHISEFGKICAKFPDKAAEVVTGSIPAVPGSGVLVIESTAEGRDGEFYNYTQRSMAARQEKKVLTEKDYRFHFFPWFDDPAYRIDPTNVVMTEKDHEYFDEVEQKAEVKLDMEQRAWYVATREADFAERPERMWQEYPSTPEEAFQVSTEGTYYRKQITDARKAGRITIVPHVQGVPVNTFWDIGRSDGTAIWFHQRIGMMNHFIKFMEAWSEPYSYFVTEMQKTGWVWGRHFLPHDGAHVRQGQDYDTQLSPQEMLHNLGLRNIEIVNPVEERMHGIQAVRDIFSTCLFDKAECKEGIIHLEQYRKRWNERTQTWSEEPLKDSHTEGADSFRQFAQGYEAASTGVWKRKKRNWRTT